MWNLTGTNAKCYEIPSNITVKVIDSTLSNPQLVIDAIDTSN